MWQRKGGGGDYKTLKQHISNTGKLAEGSEAQVSVPNPSQWHFTEEKKVTYESVQPCFVLHECFNRASVI